MVHEPNKLADFAVLRVALRASASAWVERSVLPAWAAWSALEAMLPSAVQPSAPAGRLASLAPLSPAQLARLARLAQPVLLAQRSAPAAALAQEPVSPLPPG